MISPNKTLRYNTKNFTKSNPSENLLNKFFSLIKDLPAGDKIFGFMFLILLVFFFIFKDKIKSLPSSQFLAIAIGFMVLILAFIFFRYIGTNVNQSQPSIPTQINIGG